MSASSRSIVATNVGSTFSKSPPQESHSDSSGGLPGSGHSQPQSSQAQTLRVMTPLWLVGGAEATSVSARVQCSYVIEGPKVKRGPGKGKVWWTRKCKRLAEPGTDRCWQHPRPA